MPGPATPLFIYGSCVSRDTYELELADALDLRVYVARQSLISAYGAPAPLEYPAGAALSPFQERMVRDDLVGAMPARLQGFARQPGVVLMDIVDERHGVWAFPGDQAAYATRSVELLSSRLDEHVAAHARHIPFGGDEHYGLWTAALRQFAATVEALDHPPTVVVLDVPWATHDTRGAPTPASFGLSAHDANIAQRRYLEAVAADTRFTIAKVDDVTADAGHRWGAAPFHYATDTYDRVGRAILEALRGPGGAAER